MKLRGLELDHDRAEPSAQAGMPSLRRMSSNVGAQVLSLVASAIDRLLLVGLLLRAWGPDMFADYAVIQSAGSMLTIAELGLQFYFQNVEKAAFVQRDRAAFRRLVAINQGVILLIVGAMSAAVCAFAALGGTESLLHLERIDASSGRTIFLVFALGGLITVVRSTTTTIYTAAGDFAYVVAMNAVVLTLNTVAGIGAVMAGAGPLTLAVLYFAISGVGSLVFCLWDTRRRYPDWVARPAMPSLRELRDAGVHLKWFSLQMIAPTLWLQTPILVFNAWRVTGLDIASFVLIRTMVNLIRQTFQFASVGAGLEIATLYHRADFSGAWRHTAQIGLLTTVLCATAVAAVLSFGQTITLFWTGNAALFSAPIAFWLLAPLMAVAPMQQPFALLQYANLSTGPGLQRLLQIALGPLFCVIGELSGGTIGLVIGLALAEIVAAWSLLPFLARMPVFVGFGRYCSQVIAAAAATLALTCAAGFGLMYVFPSNSGPAMTAKIGFWALTTAAPAVALALPPQIRAALSRSLIRARRPSLSSGRT